MAMGVGAIIGTGILTLIGVGVDRAGPVAPISFAIAGLGLYAIFGQHRSRLGGVQPEG